MQFKLEIFLASLPNKYRFWYAHKRIYFRNVFNLRRIDFGEEAEKLLAGKLVAISNFQ